VRKVLFRSSPLTAASFGGLVGMLNLLNEHGAVVNACNPEGRTAITTALSYKNHVLLGFFTGLSRVYRIRQGKLRCACEFEQQNLSSYSFSFITTVNRESSSVLSSDRLPLQQPF
jgi:hypothetical protein